MIGEFSYISMKEDEKVGWEGMGKRKRGKGRGGKVR